MVQPTPSFRIDWSDNGVFTGTGENVTARTLLREGATFSYGRDQARALGPMAPGNGSFALNNISRDYSPANGASPLAGLVGPGRDVLVEATHNAITYTLARMHLDDYEVIPNREDRAVRLTLLDGLAKLVGADISTPVHEGLTTGAAIDLVLDEIDWTAGRDIDNGATTVRYWWEEGTDAATAVERLVNSEGSPAFCFIGADGAFVFRDRHHRLTRAVSTTSQATFSGTTGGAEPKHSPPMTYDYGWRNIVNSVATSVEERTGTEIIRVWETEDSITIPASGVRVIGIEATDPFLDAITPVAGTDYQLDAGTVTPALSRTSGQRALLTLTAGGSAVQITGMAVRATSLPVSRTYNVEASDATSVGKYGKRSDPIDAPWVGVHDAQALADLRVARRKDPVASVEMTVKSANTPDIPLGCIRGQRQSAICPSSRPGNDPIARRDSTSPRSRWSSRRRAPAHRLPNAAWPVSSRFLGLALPQPVHRHVEGLGIGLLHFEDFGQGAHARFLVEPPSRRELGARIEDPCDNHRHHPIALFGRLRGDEPIELELAQRTEHGRDVPVRERALDLEAVLESLHGGTASQQDAQSFDDLGRPLAEIGEGTFEDLLALAVRLAQEDGGRRVAVGDDVDVHGHKLWHTKSAMSIACQHIVLHTHGYTLCYIIPLFPL